MWTGLLATVGIALLVWMLYQGIKNNPSAFSKAQLSQSTWTLGLLALVLLAVISVAVMALR